MLTAVSLQECFSRSPPTFSRANPLAAPVPASAEGVPRRTQPPTALGITTEDAVPWSSPGQRPRSPEYVLCLLHLAEGRRTECEAVLTYEHIHGNLRQLRLWQGYTAFTSQLTRGRDMNDNPETNSDSTGEWRARTGAHHQIDTMQLRALDGTPPVEEVSTEAVPGTDPYNHTTTTLQPLSERSRRRSLDDMRKLSETIKKSRSQPQQ